MEQRVQLVFDSASFRSCHASTVVHLDSEQSCLVAWFGGHKEGDDGVVIWGTERRPDGGFSEPRVFASVGPQPHWNPVLFKPDPSKALVWLFFKYGRVIADWITYVCFSNDDGRTWTVPKELLPGEDGRGGRGPVKNKMLLTSSGAWLAGSSDERQQWRAYIDRSSDGGISWEATPYIAAPAGTGVIQPSLWESRPGMIHMLLRSDCGYVCRADSEDDGRTWSKLYPISLPNNNSGLDVARLADGRLLLAYNPTSGDWAGRSPLRLSLSTDNGSTWALSVDVATGTGEFSYPAVVALADGGAVVTFTWKRNRIAYIRLEREQLEEGSDLFVPSSSLPESKGTELHSLEYFVNRVG
ncbi:hypothetical protein CYMTET_53453 [Cymbomonas tetramitiformis]|uniref:Sialidase domain-containing protein n=1 Tax=Cymbomonas tetramitiformis TaxID=36881 RepID=A0AAE0EQK4_9CHLO|nr:hypothetical protein CYMTET_53453 [Cymbomonas tetramitiformis]